VLPERVPVTPQNAVGLEKLEQANQAFKTVLSSKDGRLVMAEIFRTFHMYTTPHKDHGASTSFNCGQQSVCLWLREWMKTAGIYEVYHQIEKEDMEREEFFGSKLKDLLQNPSKGR